LERPNVLPGKGGRNVTKPIDGECLPALSNEPDWLKQIPDYTAKKEDPEADVTLLEPGDVVLQRLTTKALKVHEEILDLAVYEHDEEYVAKMKMKQVSADAITRTGVRVDDTQLRRKQGSNLPKLRALIDALRAKQTGG
jgi:anaerobic glycerol-3-phosphate dehydrogenase